MGDSSDLARDGGPAAFRILVRRHDRYLYRIARSVLLDDHEAEDVVQETYILAFTRLVDFRGDASLSTWLTRVALNEALKRRRRRRRTVPLEVIDIAPHCAVQINQSPMVAPDQDPERATAQHQLRRFLERAIDDLPEGFRTVFVMRDIEEASTEETASVLGIRQQTVKTRLHRARRMLRAALGENIGAALKDAFRSTDRAATAWSKKCWTNLASHLRNRCRGESLEVTLYAPKKRK